MLFSANVVCSCAGVMIDKAYLCGSPAEMQDSENTEVSFKESYKCSRALKDKLTSFRLVVDVTFAGS